MCNQGPKAYAWDHEINVLAHIEIEDVPQTRISNKHNGVCINTPEVFDGQSCTHSNTLMLTKQTCSGEHKPEGA